VPDIYSYDLVEAARSPGCAFCRVGAEDERRWMETFRREARRDPDLRRSFYAAGGFCPHHAWLFHSAVVERGSGAEIADVYGALADHDLEALAGLTQPARRRRRHRLTRTEPCPACTASQQSLERRIFFLYQVLEEPAARRSYLESDGLCLLHLAAVVDRAPGQSEITTFLFADSSRRLAAVREALDEFDRKRDHRYALGSPGQEQTSWTDVIRRYVGDRDQGGLTTSDGHG
jgi:Family of unknown function (DUF6062)